MELKNAARENFRTAADMLFAEQVAVRSGTG